MTEWWLGLTENQKWGLFLLGSMVFMFAVCIMCWPDKFGHDD